MSHNFTVESGSSVRLLTAGKYCDRDIVVTATGGAEDLNAVLAEQEALIAELKETLEGKAAGGGSGGGVGNLTKYTKITVTPSTTTSLAVENPLGVIPKKVTAVRLTDVATSSRKCQKYLADFDLGIGAAEYVDTSGAARYVVRETTGTVNNSYFKGTESQITLYRYNSANAWDDSHEYEVEIYA